MGYYVSISPIGMALTRIKQDQARSSKIKQDQVQYAVDRLNHRPRKVLDFKTPYEVFFG